MKYKLLLIPLFLLLTTMCEKEEGIVDPDKVDVWKRYGTSDGLVENAVFALTEDSYGNIWVGTNSKGLCKYDGRSWTSFGQSAGITGYTINALAFDADGNLWVGSWWGLDVFYGGNWIYIDKLFDQYFITTCLYRDVDDNIWIGTYGDDLNAGGLFAFDGEYFYKFTLFEQDKLHNIYSITGDESGNLWVATEGGAVFLTQQSYSIYNTSNGLADDQVSCILPDAWGDIWFGNFYGEKIGRMHNNQIELMSLFHGYSISGVITITEDREHNVWFGTGAGVIRYNGSVMDANVRADLADRFITCSLTDTKGNVWFGTSDNGIHVYRK